MALVTFDGTARTITVNAGVTSLNVATDLYSDWKEWVLDDNAGYAKAFRTFGGDATAPGQFAPSYFFLTNGWRVVVNDLVIDVDGNLYTEEANSPFVANNSVITHRTSDAAQVNTGGANFTPNDVAQAVWSDETDYPSGQKGYDLKIARLKAALAAALSA